MKRFFTIGLVFLLFSCGQEKKKDVEATENKSQSIATEEPQFFELRTYYCYPEKLDNLMDRFENHTMALFEKHGMVNMGYWIPLDNKDNTLVYLLGYKDRETRQKAWDAFNGDPEWRSVWENSRKDGPIVDSVVNKYLQYSRYSPKIKKENAGSRIFSMRTYYTLPGRLEALHTRFADHTMQIFENNGMTNIAYFNFDSIHSEAGNALLYFITFPDTAAQTASWKSFLADPQWQEVQANSIKDGPIIDSITDQLMIPAKFSPLK